MNSWDKRNIEFYGIKDDCCTWKNIWTLWPDGKQAQCNICKRMFKVKSKIKTISIGAYRLAIILSALCGIGIGLTGGFQIWG